MPLERSLKTSDSNLNVCVGNLHKSENVSKKNEQQIKLSNDDESHPTKYLKNSAIKTNVESQNNVQISAIKHNPTTEEAAKDAYETVDSFCHTVNDIIPSDPTTKVSNTNNDKKNDLSYSAISTTNSISMTGTKPNRL